jgi:hypothetical protein
MRPRCYSITGAVCLALALCAAPARANAVLNPSFESPALTPRSFCLPGACPAVPSWSGAFYLVNGDSGGGIGGVPLPPIPDGAQYIMIQNTNHADQVVTISQAGLYTLSWFDAGRGAFSGAQQYAVLFGGSTLNTFTTQPTDPWTQHSLQFSTGTGAFTLSFTGLLPFSAGDFSSFIDNIQLEPPAGTVGAPEPSTLLLAAGAFGALILRRTRARAVNPPLRGMPSPRG